jgi:F0F1-type ATP synthase membrane subunit b/b'
MRPDSPLKPGVSAMPPKLLDRLLTLLPLISLVVAFTIVSLQYARKARIQEELVKAEKLNMQLESRYKELKTLIEKVKGPGAVGAAQRHDDHHD